MFRINIRRPNIMKLLAISAIMLLATTAALSPVMPRVEGAPQIPGVDAVLDRVNPGDRGAGSVSAIGKQQVLFDCSTVSEIPTVECEALVALYDSTDGSNWSDSTGWIGDTAPCNWFGVTCLDGRVSEISLSDNQLNGIVPPEFGNLASLQHLFLDTNQLNGSVPITFTSLALDSFSFQDTDLCEPPDQAFQDWLGSIVNVQSTGVVCANDTPEADLSIAKAAITDVIVGDNVPDDPSEGLAVNQTTNRIYIYNQVGNTASVIDGVTRTVIGEPIPLGTGPIEDDDLNETTNKAYAVSPDDETVFVIDGATNAVTPVLVGSEPNHAFADDVNSDFYLTDSSTEPGSVYVISGATDSVTAIIPVGVLPTEIGSNPSTNQLYIINQADATISVIDGASNTVVATIPVGDEPSQLAVDSINDKVYVTNEGSETVSVIDGTSNTVSATIPVGLLPNGISVNPDTNQVYVLNQEDSSVSVLDGSTETLITTLPVGLEPETVRLNLITNQFYVLNLGSETVSIIDGNTLSVSNIAVGQQPVEMVVNPDLNLAYVTNSGDNTVSIIDGTTGTVVGSFPTGNGPGDVAINQQTNDVYIANSLDNRVTILPGSVVTGASLPYVLPVTNDGPDAASGVVVTDTLPSGVVFDAGNSDPSCTEDTPGTVICDLGDLANEATVNLNIGVTVDAGVADGTLLVNTATVAGNEDDPDEPNNAATATTSVQAQALGLEAEPSLTLHQDPSDGAAGVRMGLNRVFDPATGDDVVAPLDEFQAQLAYDAGCLNLVEIREMDFTLSDINIDNLGGLATITGTTPVTGTASVTGSAPFDLGHALTRLVGDNLQSCVLTMEITSLSDLDGNAVTIASSPTQNFLRGDALADETVNIADAMFIAQYLEGLRPACTDVVDTGCLHSVNAASVSQDGAFDTKTIADANFVAEYLLGLRDEFYDMIP